MASHTKERTLDVEEVNVFDAPSTMTVTSHPSRNHGQSTNLVALFFGGEQSSWGPQIEAD